VTAAAERAREVVLEARGVSKAFGGTLALRGVDFLLERGRVHALIGENGAGKSTLAKILAGVEAPTAGCLLLDGRAIAFRSAREAAGHGIALIHQELQRFEDLSVAENLFVGRERVSRWRTVDRAGEERLARETMAMLGLQLDPRALVGSLPLGMQQLVEIGRALVHRARVLLMDEPTSALSQTEVRVLFGVIRDLAARGVSIVYISHRLQEILSVADSITVLRDGCVAGSGPVGGVDVDWIVERMTGRPAAPVGGMRAAPERGEVVLAVRDLRLPAVPGRAALRGISLDLHAGEVVGIYGLMGSGRSELLESLLGVHRGAAGSITLGGVRIDGWPVHRRVAAGLAVVPEDRQRDGLVQTMSLLHNMTLSTLARLTRFGRISGARARAAAGPLADEVRLKAPSLEAPVGALSGGNQQKAVIARALMGSPRVLLMDEPSRGVDVGARADVAECIRRLAGAGMGIVFTSSDLGEILESSTRVMVLARGRIAADHEAGAVSESDVAAAASGRVDTGNQGEPCVT